MEEHQLKRPASIAFESASEVLAPSTSDARKRSATSLPQYSPIFLRSNKFLPKVESTLSSAAAADEVPLAAGDAGALLLGLGGVVRGDDNFLIMPCLLIL